jgi:glucose/arabinose dehydrogenase
MSLSTASASLAHSERSQRASINPAIYEECRIVNYKQLFCRGLVAAVLVFAVVCPSAWAQLPPIERGDIAVVMTPVATGLAAPLYGINPPGDTSRLFVLEQNGKVLVMENGALLPGLALDLQSRVAPPLNPANANDERGLLGMAFHPDFFNAAAPGYRTLYTYTSEPSAGNPLTFPLPEEPSQGASVLNYVNVVSEYKMTTPTSNVIDPATRRVIFTIGKDQGNHNGGTIAFGPVDKYLYLATGDGGARDDQGRAHLEPTGNAQVLTGGNVLGKMLRIDPLDPSLTPGSSDDLSGNGQYRIPDSNPFSGPGQVREIYAYGLRNPYRFSFDVGPSGTGDLILADVGQGTIEEINRIVAGGNYGWAVKEGTFLFDRDPGTVVSDSPGSPAGMIDPISGTLGTLQYDHDDGISITGGFVYRGSAIPELFGKYVFGDLAIRTGPRVDGRLFYADLQTGIINEFLIPQFPGHQLPNGLTVHGFGQDGNGELYAMVTNTPPNGIGGIVYMFTPVPEPGSLALVGIGALLFGTSARRRRRNSRETPSPLGRGLG